MKIELGTKVSFDCLLIRKEKWIEEEHHHYKEWVTYPCKKQDGIIIGKRNLRNGINHYDSDCGYIFDAKDSFNAYLVSTDLRTKPKLVLLENLTFNP